MNNYEDFKDIVYKKIRMNDNYCFFNSNYNFDDNIIPFFKHTNIIENLKNRIRFSNGGAFLITGLRGVGKSTLVKRAIYELQLEETIYLPVYINLSKEFEYKELLFEIIRRLYETMNDFNLLNRINSTISKQIILAYSRTSIAISKSNSINNELELSDENHHLLKSILLRNKLTLQAAEEVTFLAYSPNDIEHDLLRISELIHGYETLDIKVIFIFDELDKLTPTKKGTRYFESILGNLKNILCSIDAISIFVGGLDLYQKWNDDTVKINSLYDSIFSWHQYVPCIWDSTESLFDLLLEKEFIYEKIPNKLQFICKENYSNIIKLPFESFLTYIKFKSKGIPRRIYAEFNNFIIWDEDIPYFQISDIDANKIIAYSEIWKKISPTFENSLYKTIIEMDLTYTTCFNMIEFFFAHADTTFTTKELEKKLLYNNTLSPVNIKQIMHHLLDKFSDQYILQKTKNNVFIITDFTIKWEKNLTIKDNSLLQETFEETQIGLRNSIHLDDTNASFKRKIARYKSSEVSSFWNSYHAQKLFTNTSQAAIYSVKKNNTTLSYMAILYTEKHSKKLHDKTFLYRQPNYKLSSKYLLDTKDIVVDTYIKTSLQEIFDGYSLSHIIEAKIKLKYILLIIEQLLHLVIELNKKGYFNVNIAANNILINQRLNVKLLDIKTLITAKSNVMPITTLGYSAPEMYTDNYTKQCDIYSIGVLLWEMVNCKCLSRIPFKRHIDFELINKPARCSRKLWKIILKATQFDASERYENAEAFLKDIRSCKEYSHYLTNTLKDCPIGIVTNIFSDEPDVSYQGMHSNPLAMPPTGVQSAPFFIPGNSTSMGGETTILKSFESETAMLNHISTPIKKVYLIRLTTNEMISINKPVFKIGKEASYVDYHIKDNKAISRLHAEIFVDNDDYFLVDKASTNFTYLNQVPLVANQKTKLHNNDIIKLANESFSFHIDKKY